MHYTQVDLPATRPRGSRVEFTFLPEADGEYKEIDGEKYLNPWINYTFSVLVCVVHTVLFPFDASLYNTIQ